MSLTSEVYRDIFRALVSRIWPKSGHQVIWSSPGNVTYEWVEFGAGVRSVQRVTYTLQPPAKLGPGDSLDIKIHLDNNG